MNDLQALVTGAIIGALMKEQGSMLAIDVEPVMDAENNYLPMIRVTGRQSGTQLMVSVLPTWAPEATTGEGGSS